MSSEIVRRLMKNHRGIEFLHESTTLYEADEDEDDEERVIEPIEDDSTAPEQGNPEDYEYEEGVPEEDIPEEDYSGDEYPEEGAEEDYSEESSDGGQAPNFRGGRGPASPEGMGEKGEAPREDPEPPKEESTSNSNQYVNPLDNQYAVNYTLGDEVVLSYANGTDSELKGHVEGYDKEGFYRVKWDSGLTTNGITDIALSDFVTSKNESVCICGCTNLITEGNYIICDDCGRRIRENMKMDHLTQLDKQRPKGKKLVRSEAHPMTTATRPNIDIAESIRKALKEK